MKRSLPVLIIALTMAVLFVGLNRTHIVSAIPVADVPTARFQPPSTTEYLIALPMPKARDLEVPKHLSREQVAGFIRDLAYQQAQPIIARLAQLRTEGRVLSFEVRPDQRVIAVQIDRTKDTATTLSRLASAGYILPGNSNQSSCATKATQALTGQIMSLSRAASRADTRQPMSSLSAQATNPSIDVYIDPYYGDWSEIRGYTTPATTVTLRLLRSGSVVGTDSTTSDSGGNYFLLPEWQDCPTGDYNWMAQVGDVVEVTAAGHTVSTTIVDLSAWVDPVANTVAGVTTAGRSVQVSLDYGPSLCSTTEYNLTEPTDGSGNFSVNFTNIVNFDRTAYATVYARDTNGNSTFNDFYPYQIYTMFGSTWSDGYLKPNVSFTAV